MADTVPTPVSPKVKWGAIWAVLAGVAAAAVTGGIGALDPHVFDQLGAFGPIIYTAIVAGAGSLAAWLTKDSLRETGQVALNAAAHPQAIYINAVEAPANGSPSPAPVAEEVPHEGTFAAPAATESTIQQ